MDQLLTNYLIILLLDPHINQNGFINEIIEREVIHHLHNDGGSQTVSQKNIPLALDLGK